MGQTYSNHHRSWRSKFWYLLQFISSVFWSVYHTSLSLACLELSYGILYYLSLLLKGAVSLISFSFHLYPQYRVITHFCELILHTATLVKEFISWYGLLCNYKGHINIIISCANKYTFIPSFSFFILLKSVISHIALVEISSIMSVRVYKSLKKNDILVSNSMQKQRVLIEQITSCRGPISLRMKNPKWILRFILKPLQRNIKEVYVI